MKNRQLYYHMIFIPEIVFFSTERDGVPSLTTKLFVMYLHSPIGVLVAICVGCCDGQ